MKCTWSLGERMFAGDFKRRMMLFDYLVKSIMFYGVEIWGWKEMAKIEGIQERYMRWILGLDRNTPGYIVREECKRDKLKIEAGKRAIKYENKIRSSQNKILKDCLKVVDKEESVKDKWRKMREDYLQRNGLSHTEFNNRRRAGINLVKELENRDIEVLAQEQTNKINAAQYNSLYKDIHTADLPQYLRLSGRGRTSLIARFRCGNEVKGNVYWEKDEDKKRCRICRQSKETIEHLRRECLIHPREEVVTTLLDEFGTGLLWMKEIVEKRKRIQEE